jgi:hypothetical protein
MRVRELDNTWTNINFKKSLYWFYKIKKKNKSSVKRIHLEKMNKWEYNKKKGIISHKSKEFFIVVSILNIIVPVYAL